MHSCWIGSLLLLVGLMFFSIVCRANGTEVKPLEESAEDICAAMKSLNTVNNTVQNIITTIRNHKVKLIRYLQDVETAFERTSSAAAAAKQYGGTFRTASVASKIANDAMSNATRAMLDAETSHNTTLIIEAAANIEAQSARDNATAAAVALQAIWKTTVGTARLQANHTDCVYTPADQMLTSQKLNEHKEKLVVTDSKYNDEHKELKELWARSYLKLFLPLDQLHMLLQKLEWDVATTSEMETTAEKAADAAVAAQEDVEKAAELAAESATESVRAKRYSDRVARGNMKFKTIAGFHEEPLPEVVPRPGAKASAASDPLENEDGAFYVSRGIMPLSQAFFVLAFTI
ncbi:T. brucei spp.-specific protein [Trypanosoma brucei gambiense DAL972]|uniref:T. brucei spp.-specific protein n=1 Tax=Trypanosoma brucei gambiense (strain MHOM/CI/86/DAL972) TaxID=679716 RepID=C9ZZQ2_TRYB9|nr:T. brucei spp.-specific protein [Trypanosoma brucei gambiense DAL972]CBH14901.1 T. brucei spp.-specific protein [Trypanosoma brucei gambiense DAL972]|eukprot:XP_011777167.1 T. brucei spp.-specific protein [Trypanosoma brucei gambiense DAL972]